MPKYSLSICHQSIPPSTWNQSIKCSLMHVKKIRARFPSLAYDVGGVIVSSKKILIIIKFAVIMQCANNRAYKIISEWNFPKRAFCKERDENIERNNFIRHENIQL